MTLLSLLPAVSFATSGEARADASTASVTGQSASERAAATGESVEVLSERTEYTTTVANPDGTFTLTQSTQPLRARADVMATRRGRRLAGGGVRLTFEVIAGTLREQIHSGRLKPGDALPTQTALMREFGAAA
ncbi:GntR family transcriptional regulator [Streptomyces ossamyceticus]|uniref:GntR family transcriptional regulator n=1 Tax=Streptomyces ossamyceticus TaxID=249581 RepID=UPI001F0B31C9|nr:GntR family transcriptional regulator [Streptomyces ossamyceticus]